ncbi:VOC family protein [Pelagicoccus sp. SDUM812005]|uniref:VOC family protein n=1 Tax=Pelagicoccus sp. SDUM812005 TaxID=3041257 RepID=UPI00280F61D9|nr:VOC family protein [Pelagicoccus sp. SDUM812005]MDQ8181060.1 VOC family protein [Pelagicoccus sp. SDUM812005]
MKATRIFETILYAEDLDSALWFYRDVLGLELQRSSELFLVFRLESSALIIFNPAQSSETGREIPAHGSVGDGHLAFASKIEDLPRWLDHFTKHNISIETKHDWSEGGYSIYVRDPAGNSVEIAPPTLWGGWDI